MICLEYMSTPHILVFGDDSPILDYIRQTLLKEGYATIYQEELPINESTADTDASFIIANYNSTDGEKERELLLKASLIYKDIPLLFLVDNDIPQFDTQGKNITILKKPFAFQDLFAVIKKLRSHSPQLNLISVDNLSIDLKSHEVTRKGIPITLTKKEFTLLSYLVRHSGDAVSRSDLLEHVWGMQIDPLSNTIEAHILSLRRKIDRPGLTKLIHTIPRFGYRVSEHI